MNPQIARQAETPSLTHQRRHFGVQTAQPQTKSLSTDWAKLDRKVIVLAAAQRGKEIAERFAISQATLSRWRHGKYTPSPAMQERLDLMTEYLAKELIHGKDTAAFKAALGSGWNERLAQAIFRQKASRSAFCNARREQLKNHVPTDWTKIDRQLIFFAAAGRHQELAKRFAISQATLSKWQHGKGGTSAIIQSRLALMTEYLAKELIHSKDTAAFKAVLGSDWNERLAQATARTRRNKVAFSKGAQALLPENLPTDWTKVDPQLILCIAASRHKELAERFAVSQPTWDKWLYKSGRLSPAMEGRLSLVAEYLAKELIHGRETPALKIALGHDWENRLAATYTKKANARRYAGPAKTKTDTRASPIILQDLEAAADMLHRSKTMNARQIAFKSIADLSSAFSAASAPVSARQAMGYAAFFTRIARSQDIKSAGPVMKQKIATAAIKLFSILLDHNMPINAKELAQTLPPLVSAKFNEKSSFITQELAISPFDMARRSITFIFNGKTSQDSIRAVVFYPHVGECSFITTRSFDPQHRAFLTQAQEEMARAPSLLDVAAGRRTAALR